MRFARIRATAEDPSVEPAAADESPGAELAAVDLLLLDEGRRLGWIDVGGQRTSDWLNAHPEVPVHGLADPETTVTEPPDPATAPARALDREDIVWVVPPPLPQNRHLRLHRRRVLVHLELDGWEVSGQAHVRPGADAIDQVMRGTRPMVPLTEVQVASREHPGQGAVLDVLIVNRSHVRRVVIDAPHQSAAVPEPVGTAPAAAADVVPQPTPEPVERTVPQPAPPEAAPPPIETGAELLQSALVVLLEAGVIDVVEFQSIRARIPAPPSP
jgi:hypothetical protein